MYNIISLLCYHNSSATAGMAARGVASAMVS